MKKETTAKAMLSVSMAIFGTLGLFTRNIAVSSGELALYRAVLVAVLIAVYLTITKQKIRFQARKKEIFLLLLSGMAMGVNWILLFQACLPIHDDLRRDAELLFRSGHRDRCLPRSVPRSLDRKVYQNLLKQIDATILETGYALTPKDVLLEMM